MHILERPTFEAQITIGDFLDSIRIVEFWIWEHGFQKQIVANPESVSNSADAGHSITPAVSCVKLKLVQLSADLDIGGHEGRDRTRKRNQE
jgi:hypothetical protein